MSTEVEYWADDAQRRGRLRHRDDFAIALRWARAPRTIRLRGIGLRLRPRPSRAGRRGRARRVARTAATTPRRDAPRQGRTQLKVRREVGRPLPRRRVVRRLRLARGQ